MNNSQDRHNQQPEDNVRPVPADVLEDLGKDIAQAGGEWTLPPEHEGCIGWTMFDTPQATDGTVVGLLPREQVGRIPNRALVRIKSMDEKGVMDRRYLGIVQTGPFAEPDGLRADAPVVVTTTVRGGRIFMPRYHGRISIELLGEEVNGALVPPRFRPFPNSTVFLLDAQETAQVMHCGGDVALGRAIGHDDLLVGIPSDRKGVLPRHTGVLGTTGSGKSTTVSRLIHQAQKAGMAVVLLDVEGEYTETNQPARQEGMLNALKARGIPPEGVSNTHIYHLVGCETTNPRHPSQTTFTLPFSRLSPYAVVEILDMSDAQAHRYWQAYEATKALLREFGIFPSRVMGRVDQGEDRQALEINEFESGYPRMTLSHLLDIVNACFHMVNKDEGTPDLYNKPFKDNIQRVMERVRSAVRSDNHPVSWRSLQSRLWQLQRLGVFDVQRQGVTAIKYSEMVQPGRVSIVDLSDTESPDLRNLVIADMLRGVQEAQEERYNQALRDKRPLPHTLVIIEEAHEFLSGERISKMPNLFQQVSRVAKRGRKRWLGLVFVTQHPQHLPSELLGLINNYILHRINDAEVIRKLRHSIGGIDEGLWDRLTALAPGQAIASFVHMARPLLVAVDPTPCKLRMAEE